MKKSDEQERNIANRLYNLDKKVYETTGSTLGRVFPSSPSFALDKIIYAGCDALLVPSRFEPCGLTQLISMRYGAVPIVRETGGLKDTVQPYNAFENTGNGFTFDRYESGLLYDAINRAKTLYFENRVYWDDMVVRDMNKDVSWEQSAKQYKDMYVELTPRY